MEWGQSEIQELQTDNGTKLCDSCTNWQYKITIIDTTYTDTDNLPSYPGSFLLHTERGNERGNEANRYLQFLRILIEYFNHMAGILSDISRHME